MQPVKITQQQNGSFTWACPIETEYFRKEIRPGLYACFGIAVFLLIFGAILSIQYHDWKTFLIVAGCTAVFLLITLLIFGLAFSAKNPMEQYILTDEYVKTGYGRSSVFFDFKKARTAVFASKYIELQGNVARTRIYIPEEDYDLVKGYIQSRLPGECDVRYEWNTVKSDDLFH